MVSPEMEVPFVGWAEDIHYQRMLTVLLATCRRDGVAPAASYMGFAFLDHDCSQLWSVVECRFLAHDHHFKTPLRKRHISLVG